MTKVHLIVNALGLPMKAEITGGEVSTIEDLTRCSTPACRKPRS